MTQEIYCNMKSIVQKQIEEDELLYADFLKKPVKYPTVKSEYPLYNHMKVEGIMNPDDYEKMKSNRKNNK